MKALRAWLIITIFLGFASARAQWREPINMEPPICTEQFEVNASLNAAEDMIVLKTSRGFQAGLFTSRKTNGQWMPPQYVLSVGNPPNIYPCLSPDGSEIYFSCLCGGYGDYDIWKVVFDSVEGAWSEPINLGANVNDEVAQYAPFMSYNGQNLYFMNFSLRFEGIAVSHREGESWSYAELLTNNYNLRHAENVSLNYGEDSLYFSKDIPNIGPQTFISVKDEYNNWSDPEPFLPLNQYGRHAYPRVNSNGARVYFSKAMEGGYGSHDIWFVENSETSIEGEIETEADENLLLVYPNPTNDNFHIRISGIEEEDLHLFIFDILGRELDRIEINNSVNSLHWPRDDHYPKKYISSGAYFIQLRTGGGKILAQKKAVLLK